VRSSPRWLKKPANRTTPICITWKLCFKAEVEDRERRAIELRMKDARLPRMKTLAEFDLAQSLHIPASRIRALAEGGYLERAEPVLMVGEPGTGKSHLATALAIAACRQRRRVRFITAAALVNHAISPDDDQGHPHR
jgi:DNA replication protein DnaC